MDEQLKLELLAVDRLQALEKMLDILNNVDKSLADINASFSKLDKASPFLKWSAQLNIAKSALGAFKTVAGGVLGTLQQITGLDLSLSGIIGGGRNFIKSAIEGISFKQETLIQFEKFFKSKDEAAKQYASLFTIASQTPGTVEGLKDATLSFAASGFSKEEIDSLQGAYADVQALGGEGLGKNFAALTAKIRGQGRLTEEALAFESAEKVEVGDIKLNIGRRLKLTGDPDSIRGQVTKLISSGGVGVNLGIASILDTLKEKLGDNKLGDFAKKIATESISGALSNVEEGVQNIFRNLDLKNIPSLQKFLSNISDALADPKVKKSVEETIDLLIKPLESFSKEDLIKTFQTVAGIVKDIAGGVVVAFNYIKDIVQQGFNGPKILGDFISGAADLLLYIGAIIGKGIKASFTGGGDDIIKEFERKKQELQLKSDVQRFGGTNGGPTGISTYSYEIGPNGERIPIVKPTALSTTPTPSPVSASTNNSASVVNNIVVNGDADPNEVAKAATDGTKKGLAQNKNYSDLTNKRLKGR